MTGPLHAAPDAAGQKSSVQRETIQTLLGPVVSPPTSHSLGGERQPVELPYLSLGALFTGRDDWLAKLHRSLQCTHDAQATAIVGKAIHGLGGVGKTRLAVEYAWRHRADYSALLFVTADSPENLRRNLAALVGPMVLDLPQRDATEEAVKLAAALRWLGEHPGWLLILDNVDTKDAATEVERLLPRLQGGHVLMTSRIARFGGGVEPLELDVLLPDDAAKFLLDRTARRRPQPTDAADAQELARDLDGLALALEQAGAYIEHRRIAIADYLSAWRAHLATVQTWHDPRVMQYPRSLAVTWQTTIDQLGPGEVALLRLLAWFAPDPLPLFVLEGEHAAAIWREASGLCAARNERLGDAIDLMHALANLADFSMLRWDAAGQTVTVHRVVQEIVRTQLPLEAIPQWVRLSIRLLDVAAPFDADDVRTWPRWSPLRPHVAAGIEHADESGIADQSASLMSQLGLLLYFKALQAEAEPLMRRALEIDERTFGEVHPDVATGLNNLAMLLKDTNRQEEAEPLFRRALAISEETFGAEHPEVATVLNNLAQLLKATNRLVEAEPMMRRALAICEQSFGVTHPEVATCLNNLAMLLKDTNRLAEAEPMMHRALGISEKSFGADHPDVATVLNNLSQLLQATNRLAEAEAMIRRALAIDEQAYGAEHPNVARDLNTLSQLLQATNQLTEAEPLMRRALAIDEASLGVTNPEFATCLNNLAMLLKHTNRLEEAEPLLRRALAISEETLGAEHLEVATVLNNLAQLLQATNRGVEAEPLMRRALAIDEQEYGREHSNIAIRLDNLAQLLQAMNRLEEAEPMMRRALAISEQTFGAEHPEVATDLNNLARLLQTMNCTAEAEPLLRRALAIDERSFGPEHPEVATVLNNLAGLLQATSRPAEAEPLVRRWLQIHCNSRRNTSPEHPNWEAMLRNYQGLLESIGLDDAEIAEQMREFKG